MFLVSKGMWFPRSKNQVIYSSVCICFIVISREFKEIQIQDGKIYFKKFIMFDIEQLSITLEDVSVRSALFEGFLNLVTRSFNYEGSVTLTCA